jgi:hypothetical protein
MTTNVLNLPGNYKILAANGLIYIESGSTTEINAGDTILLNAANNLEVDVGNEVLVTAPTQVFVDSPLTELTGDLVVTQDSYLNRNTFVGDSTGDEVEFQARVISDFVPKDGATFDLGIDSNTWKRLNTEEIETFSPLNTGNPYGRPYDPGDIYGSEAQRREASVYVTGGVGIEKDLNVGGFIYGRIETAVTTTFIAVTSTNIDNYFYLTFVSAPENDNPILADITSSEETYPGLRYNPFLGKLLTEKINVVSTETSTSTNTGALVVDGGVGVAKDVVIGQDLLPAKNNSSNIGSTSSQWAEAYIQDLYAKYIKTTSGPLTIAPTEPLTEIFGDIRVRGATPIGTAPVVTNTLYVTVDGNDTNDGRAQDSSRACRTITGAVNSPYYKEGTQILVSAGFYLEDNPIRLKPYTSVRGSDIRTTFIEPINKTQDLFHLDSGCYLNYMTFLNGRSGLLEGPYAPEFNRGAYATAFPPLTGSDRIDLFHSPYVQNCTNQSGPWLRDGTMFVPNQTVQVPSAVGTGSWPTNTTTIVVNLTTGTITQGMYINAGQQNPGFFNARTLLLANKPFLQEQVVKYVDFTFNSSTFVYDSVKCSRDIGLIVDSIATDLVYDSESESIFSGLQYWRQSGYVDAIEDQITTTSNAISYVKTQAVAAVTPVSALLAASVSSNFDLITTILNTSTVTLSNGTFAEWITDLVAANPNGAPSTNPTTISAYDALLAAKSTIQTDTINYITSSTGLNFTNFDTSTCFRDVGYIIDSIAFDLLHGGKKQSIKSGVYYFGYTSTATEIPNEVPQTVQAYNFIKSLVPNVVLGKPILNVYQTGTVQVTALNSATTYEVEIIEDKIEIITDIIRNGPSKAPSRIPMNLDRSGVQGVLNAYDLLVANKNFIINETIAFINSTIASPFVYSREKCFRDVGILVENISYDAAFGGNQKAVESGLAYYDGVISRIAGQETQTIAAIDYLNSLAQNVITNTTCTDLFFDGIVTTATYNQVINLALTGGEISADSIDNLFDTITDIIEKGPESAPQIYTSTGPDAAFVSAETLMQANRTFIQQDTINYINNIVYAGALPYSEIKCRRDTGLIIDSILSDLKFPTAQYSQSTFAGLQYWSQGNYVGDIEDQLNPTISAITYLKETASKILRNITPADDLVPRYYSGVITQNTSLEAATTNEVNISNNLFDIIIEIVNGNKTGWTDRIVSNGNATNLTSIYNAYNLLQENKEYLAYEITAYVDATNFGLVYDAGKCRRDVGYMIDAICYDMIYGGNRQSVQNGLYYFGFTSGTLNIHGGQNTATIAAFNHLATITNLIIQGQPVPAKQTNKSQIYSVYTATAAEGLLLSKAISTITNIIQNGVGVAALPTAIAFTATTSTNIINAYDLVNLNKEFIIEEVIAYIDQTFNADRFNYNEEKCYRDVGLIVDAVSQDILLGGNQKSIEAGVAYWSGGYNVITGQETTTTLAINHAKDIALQIIANTPVTPQSGTVITQIINPYFQYGGDYMPQQAVARNFNIITSIIEKGPLYAPPVYAGGGLFALTGLNGSDVKISPQVTSVTTASYDETLCRRDGNYILTGVYYDTGLGTNYNGITSGNAYRRGTASSQSVINNELPQTIAAINYLKTSTELLFISNDIAVTRSNTSFDDLIYVLKGYNPPDITFTNPSTASTATIAAKDQLVKNKEFIQGETVAWIKYQIDNNIGPFTNFDYDWQLCYRDVGYIVDALCYDILYSGNSASKMCAQAYFTQSGQSVIYGETSQSVLAFQHMSTVSQKVITGVPVVATTGTFGSQSMIGNFATTVQSTTLSNLVSIITNAISAGSLSGLPATVNPSISWAPDDVETVVNTLLTSTATMINNMIDIVNSLYTGTYVVGLNTSTIGFGVNSTLYFGNTLIFPLRDYEVEELSLELTGSTSTWNQRKVDPVGSMGGSLVDGSVISDRSPIQSFVYDAFTQVNQGGRGVHIKNDGYAQLVSVFTIFCSIGVEVESGGIASIVNSNANFGNICLQARGYGDRKFSGTIYNPPFKAYPDNPTFNQYFPNGYWPNGGRVRVFLPDLDDRPHISLVMEVVPPDTVIGINGLPTPQRNEQGFPGFLNANPTLATLTTGSITINGINTEGIAVGNYVYIRDQFGKTTGSNFVQYADTGTIVTDIGYQSITLNKALTNGGGEIGNDRFFDLYFCGNAYYTVLSSEVGANPLPVGVNVLSVAAGLPADQVAAHVQSLQHLNTITNSIINNLEIVPTAGNTLTQITNNLILDGGLATTFIDLRFNDLINIVNAPNLTSAEAVVPMKLRTISGPTVQGAGGAISLIESNLDFMTEEVSKYVEVNNPGLPFNKSKCKRDVKIILQRLIYDIESGGKYNSVMSGLSYWQRDGTHHIVQLGENVRRTDLFPDGATVNFYQRSYISASGYVFEYVGAGIDYGALPQRGVADPVQSKEVVMLDSGKVFFTSTDQNGDFRIGPGLVISQATGVLSGRTFTKSLFANMTPFILAIESGGG